MSDKTSVKSDDVYDIKKYTDDELYSILGLSNPSDRELEITINNRIKSFSDNSEGEYVRLTKFFEDMLDHFFENNDNLIADTTELELEPAPATTTETSLTNTEKPKMNGNGMGSNINYTYPFQYTTGNINALKRQTTTRMISINSSDRDRDIYPVSTSFLCNLSENLSDVVNIKMSSVKIPNTWYTVADGFGGNFFYIVGNSPGITNGNYDWKISIIPGNYTETTIISSVNDSLATLISTVSDISFVSGSNIVSYNVVNKKTTFSFNFNQYYNESYYYIKFPVFTNPYSSGESAYGSIPGFLGFCKDTYPLNTIYSTYSLTVSDSDISSSVLYTLTESTASFIIYVYEGPGNFDGSTYLDKIDVGVSVTGDAEDRAAIIERFNAVLSGESKLIESSFSVIDMSYSSIDFVAKMGISFCVKYNRYSADTVNHSNLKTAVVFPDDTSVWLGNESCFGFDVSVNEMNDIVSERGKVFNKYPVSSNPYVLIKCVRDGYSDIVDSGHDISFGISNSKYVLDDLFSDISASIGRANTGDGGEGINSTFKSVYNIPSMISGSETSGNITPYFGVNIYRKFDNAYFSFNTDVSNIFFGNSSFFKFSSSTFSNVGISSVYSCDISYSFVGYSIGVKTMSITGNSMYFPSDFGVDFSFDMSGVVSITDIVGVINRTFVEEKYNPVGIYGVYLKKSRITAGNKRSNVSALQGIEETCSYTNDLLIDISNQFAIPIDNVLYSKLEIWSNNFVTSNNTFNTLKRNLISGLNIQTSYSADKTTLDSYITEIITYMDNNNGIDTYASDVYNSSNYISLLFQLNKLSSLLLIYDGDTDDYVNNQVDYQKDNYKYNLNMDVTMSMTNDDYVLYLCDPSSVVIDTVDGGGVDVCGNFTSVSTNFWYDYLKYSRLFYNLSEGGGIDVSYQTMITAGDVVYSNSYYLTSDTNYFYIRASYDASGGVYSTVANTDDSSLYYHDIKVVLGLDVKIGYTTEEIVDAIQLFFDDSNNVYLNGSTIILDEDTKKVTIRLSVNKRFNPLDYKIIFYDNTLFTTCKNTLSNAVKSITWDTTIGWMLGFRKLIEYPLSLENMYYDSDTETTYYRTYYRSVFLYNANTGKLSITGDTTVSVNIYNYFMIILDDFNQNHLNDGLITITNRDTSMPLPSYTSKSYIQCDMTSGTKYIDGVSSTVASNKLTANQIYSANQKMISNSGKTSKLYSAGLYAKDMIALLPNTNNEINQSDSYLKTQERSYFGPVCLSRMKIQLVNDRGSIVDLNGSEWSFVMTAEVLYSEI
jgi:hypothetical protein